MENERKVSLIGIFMRIIIIITLIVVLVILFNNNKFAEMNTNTNNTANEILMNQNLMAMKDAAREYFTVNKMPKGEDEIILYLKEMYEKEMIVTLKDGNMNECSDDDSYVRVRKVNDEYEIKVVLTCGSITKKIVSNVGCYDFCKDNNCNSGDTPSTCNTVTKTKYEYAKKTNDTSLWGEFSKWSKIKVYASSNRIVETKQVNELVGTQEIKTDAIETISYSCPSGYTMSSDKKTCSKTTTSVETIPATRIVSYSCPTGYNMSADKKTCSKTVTDTVDRISHTTCPSGYTQNGSSCQKKLTMNATPHIKISFECPNGVCQTVSTIDYYYCSDSSYKLSGKTCYKYTTTSPTITYSCPSGYSMSGTSCIKTTTSTINSTESVKYTCNNGYTLTSDNYCIKNNSSVSTIESTKKYSYSCNEGTLSGKFCIKKENVYENVTYYRFKLLNVVPGRRVTKWSYSNNDQSLIKNGYKLTGNKKTETVSECSK